ncbi:MAG TPA: hypothetical protein ENI95_12395 [Chloroflexi bacterium]|nr:hypothetical protein [Chloroflexota bacterium]
MKTGKNFPVLYWVVVAVTLALGAVGFYWRLSAGHRMANYGELIVWGLWVATYIFFVGISAGSFVIAALVYVFDIERFRPIAPLALLVSLITLPVGLLNIWVDLGHMERFYELYVRPSLVSIMSVEVWLYTAFLIVLVAIIWLEFFRKAASEEEQRSGRLAVRVLSAIGLVLVILFEGAGGALYGVAAARPAWHGGLFPLLFILSAMVVGTALLAGIYAFFSSERGTERHRQVMVDLGKLMLGLVVMEVLFTFSEYSIAFYGSVPSEIEPLKVILTGPFWYVFWIGQVGLGMVLPIVLLVWSRTREEPLWIGVAGLGVVIATFAMRLNIVIPALALPELEGLINATPSPRITTSYVPSSMEWFVAIGTVGLALALFAIGYSLLPVEPQQEKEVSHG